jgi:hypothetical protein
LRFNGGVVRDPAFDGWMRDHAGVLGTLAQHWFEAMRECGDEVRELLHDGFFQGAALRDRSRLLQGKGKFMRYGKLRPGVPADVAVLGRLVQLAYPDIKVRVENG